MKVMLIHNMRGKNHSELKNLRAEIAEKLSIKFGETVDIIDNYFHIGSPDTVDNYYETDKYFLGLQNYEYTVAGIEENIRYDIPRFESENSNRLWHLGRSIQQLGQADAIVFAPGNSDNNGCQVEKLIAKLYDIPIITLEDEVYSTKDELIKLIEDPNKYYFTEEEFIKIRNAGLCSKMHIGSIIKLNNKYCDTYQVIGVNHDNTTDTVDIMAMYKTVNMAFGENNEYIHSKIRKWINNDYFNAFSDEIKNIADAMKVECTIDKNFKTTIYDRVKILSAAEMNITEFNKTMPGYDDSSKEGEGYPIFEPKPYSYYSFDKIRPNCDSSSYWLRSLDTELDAITWGVFRGRLYYDRCSEYNGILPVLRFSAPL